MRCWKSNVLVTFTDCLSRAIKALLQRSNVLLSDASVFQGTMEPIWFVNRIAYVAHCMNQWRIADFSSQPSDENFHQLGVVFVRVFPYSFT
jgi:hypothetical protein